MKPKHHLLRRLSISAVLACSASSAHAGISYFDVNSTTAGSGVTASGSYGWTAGAYWAADNTGTSATSTWTPGDNAVFASTGDAGSNSYTVALATGDGPQTRVKDLTVNSGNLTISQGASNFVLDATGAWTVNSGANLSITSSSYFWGSLNMNNNSLTMDTQGTAIATVAGMGNGNGGLTKTGAGTMTITGHGNYTGGTTVNGGTLVLNAPMTADSVIGTGLLTINAGARVDAYVNSFGTTWQTPVAINGGTLNQVSNDSHMNSLAMTGGTLSGAGGTAFYLHSAVTVNASAASSTISAPTLGLSNNITFTVADGAAATDLLVSSGWISGGYGLTKAGAGTMTITGHGSYTGGTTVNEGTLVLNAPYGADSAVGAGTLTINAGARVDTYITSFGTTWQTPVAINGGTLNQVSADSHLNTLAMTGGTLSGAGGTAFGLHSAVTVNASATTSTISVPSLAMFNNITFTVADGAAATDLMVSSGWISGGYGLTKAGAGTMTITGHGSYTGGTTVNEGTLILNAPMASDSVVGTGTLTINTGARVEAYVNSFGTTWQTPVAINGGTLYQVSNDSHMNAVTMTGGTLSGTTYYLHSPVTVNASADPSTISATLWLQSGIAFTVADGSAAIDLLVSGAIYGGSGLTKSGPGTMKITSACDYAGSTTVTAGTLVVSGSVISAGVTVQNTATLGGNGHIGGGVTIQAGGHHALAVASDVTNQVTRTITGTLDVSAVGDILDLTADVPPADGTYVLATASGGILGAPETVNQSGVSGTFSINGNNLELIVGGGSDFGSWIGGFTFAPGADLSESGDPDGDGLSNQQEYAFGLKPNDGSSVNPITMPLNQTTGLFTYTRRKPSLTGLAYSYEYSTTLDSWSALIPDGTSTDGGDPIEAVTVDVPNDLLGNAKCFVRVKASPAP